MAHSLGCVRLHGFAGDNIAAMGAAIVLLRVSAGTRELDQLPAHDDAPVHVHAAPSVSEDAPPLGRTAPPDRAGAR